MKKIGLALAVLVLAGCSTGSKSGDSRGSSPSRQSLVKKAAENKYAKFSLALRSGQDKDVEAAAGTLLSQDPNDVMVLNGLAMHHFRKGRLGLTKLLLKQAYDLQPNSSSIQSNLGLVFLEDGEPIKAIAAFKESLMLEPGNVEAAANLGGVYSRFQDCEKALPHLEQAYGANYRPIDVLNNYAMCLGVFNRAEAENVFRQALVLEPRNPRVMLNAAIYWHERKNKTADAINMVKRIRSLQVPKDILGRLTQLEQQLAGKPTVGVN
jgi:Flp pilus assembly protein TadD